MPAADETRTCASCKRPYIICTDQQFCQEHESQNGSAPSFLSGVILLLNFEESHRQKLTILLQRLRYKLFVPEEHGLSLQELKDEELWQADFILFDLTRLNHDAVWLPLRRLSRLRKPDGMPLFVHCFSRIDRGTDFHRMVEKLGARMDYYGA